MSSGVSPSQVRSVIGISDRGVDRSGASGSKTLTSERLEVGGGVVGVQIKFRAKSIDGNKNQTLGVNPRGCHRQQVLHRPCESGGGFQGGAKCAKYSMILCAAT